MRIDRAAHLPWVIFILAVTAAASLLYEVKFYPQEVPSGLRFFGETPPAHATIGGTPLGLVLGTVAFGIFVFAALLGVRKRLPKWRLGTMQRWLRAHIWLTLLTIPLILLHSGFRLGGPMTTLLMGLYAVVMVSGIYGLILQHKLPTLMKERLPAEIVYEQIPNIRAQLCWRRPGSRMCCTIPCCSCGMRPVPFSRTTTIGGKARRRRCSPPAWRRPINARRLS